MAIIPEKARERINEVAKELLDARTDAEYAEAARAMAALLRFYGINA